MPNSGEPNPTDPLRPVGGSGSTPASEPAAAPEGAAAAEGPKAAESASAIDAAPDPAAPQAIAADLASGAIDAQTAQARLIDAAVRARLPPGAAPEAIAAVRAEVEALVGQSPMLAQLLRP